MDSRPACTAYGQERVPAFRNTMLALNPHEQVIPFCVDNCLPHRNKQVRVEQDDPNDGVLLCMRSYREWKSFVDLPPETIIAHSDGDWLKVR